MCCRIAEPDWPVMPRADDLHVSDRDRADWNFTLRLGATGLGDSLGHKLQVFAGRHPLSRLTLARPGTKIGGWGQGT